jgi:hypothetical protein
LTVSAASDYQIANSAKVGVSLYSDVARHCHVAAHRGVYGSCSEVTGADDAARSDGISANRNQVCHVMFLSLSIYLLYDTYHKFFTWAKIRLKCPTKAVLSTSRSCASV